MSDVTYCLDDSIKDRIILFVQPAIRDFVRESRYVRTVDSFLVLLGTLVSRLEEIALMLGLNSNDVLMRVLACTEVSEALRPLAKYVDVVSNLVSTDPRHKGLRPYLPLICSCLSELTPVSREFDIIRPSMFELEGERYTQQLKRPYTVFKPKPLREEDRVALAPRRPERVDREATFYREATYFKPEANRRIHNVTTKRRKASRRKVIVILALVILVLVMLLIMLFYASHAEPIKTYVDVEKTPTELDIKMSVLEELNKIRAAHGLPPVQLLNLSIAQYRANDMVKNAYYGHCDLSGVPTTFYYTLLGGVYAMEENVGYVGKCRSPPLEPDYIDAREAMNYALKSLRDMVYNDVLSNWGHRDSLLDPTNNYVDIGVAWGKGVFIIVIQMNKVWVSWSRSPSYVNNRFEACGKLLLNNSEITHVLIYKYTHMEKSSEECTLSSLCPLLPLVRIINNVQNRMSLCMTANSTCTSYSLGTPVAGVVPSPNMYYQGIETIIASRWVQLGDYFCIEFTWMPREKGIYTIVIYARNTLNLTHPYRPNRYKNHIPILEYTITSP
ncbi:MAG: CAP domain-containing protein [Desulfurococcaceae archaeon]